MNQAVNNEAKLLDVDSNSSLPQTSQIESSTDQITVPTGGTFFIPFGFIVAAWLVLILSRLEIWKAIGNRKTATKQYTKTPCSQCRFFQNNPYLKCAVHPSKALSEEAKDCPDYWGDENDKFSR